MAENTINARIKVAAKNHSNWNTTTSTVKPGELLYDLDHDLLEIANSTDAAQSYFRGVDKYYNASNIHSKSFYFYKNDNKGYPTYQILFDVTNWWNTTDSTPSSPASAQGLIGQVYNLRIGGNLGNTNATTVIGTISYNRSTYRLESSNSGVLPCIIQNTNTSKYYLALKLISSSSHFLFTGIVCNTLLKTQEVLTTDTNGTMPSGWAVARTGTYMSWSGNAGSATSLLNTRTLWGQSFNGTANVTGSLSNTGNITPSAAGTYALGSSDLPYKYLYLSDTNSKKALFGIDTYLSIDMPGNELRISGTNNENLHINYRKTINGYAPATIYWHDGSDSTYAGFYIGDLYSGITKTYSLGSSSLRWLNAYVDKIELNTDDNIGKSFISFWKPSFYTWKEYMSSNTAGTSVTGGNPSTLGNVTTYAIRNLIESNSSYGWIWESSTNTQNANPTARMALSSNNGQLTLAGNHVPSVTNTYSLGTSDLRWLNAYVTYLNNTNVDYYWRSYGSIKDANANATDKTGKSYYIANGTTNVTETVEDSIFATLLTFHNTLDTGGQIILPYRPSQSMWYRGYSDLQITNNVQMAWRKILDTNNAFVDDLHNSEETTKTATAKQIWAECEKRNVQFIPMSTIDGKISTMTEDEFINTYAYGIRWTQGTGTITKVGNPVLSESIPVQNSLRACVYKINPVSGGFTVSETIDGTTYSIQYGAKREFLYWLDNEDWTKKEDGTASVINGTDNTGVAIYHTKFYGKSFEGKSTTSIAESGNQNYVFLSLVKYDNTWEEIKEGFTDFAKATVVNNMARCYTGATISTSISRSLMNEYARNSGAHQMSYDEYKWIMYWLPVIEFGTFLVESNEIPSTWSWGSDVVDRDTLTTKPTYGYPMLYSNTTLGYTYITSGFTNALGTHTGWVKYTNNNYTANVLPVARYRGFEIQRCAWTNLQGVWGEQTSLVCTIFATKNRALFSKWTYTGGYLTPYSEYGCITDLNGNELAVTERINNETWSLSAAGYWTSTTYKTKDKHIRYVGKQTNNYIKEFTLNSCGDMICLTGSSDTTIKCDYSYTNSNIDSTPTWQSNPRYIIAEGSAAYSLGGGPGYLTSHAAASHRVGLVAFRCCWNVDEYESVMN